MSEYKRSHPGLTDLDLPRFENMDHNNNGHINFHEVTLSRRRRPASGGHLREWLEDADVLLGVAVPRGFRTSSVLPRFLLSW